MHSHQLGILLNIDVILHSHELDNLYYKIADLFYIEICYHYLHLTYQSVNIQKHFIIKISFWFELTDMPNVTFPLKISIKWFPSRFDGFLKKGNFKHWIQAAILYNILLSWQVWFKFRKKKLCDRFFNPRPQQKRIA